MNTCPYFPRCTGCSHRDLDYDEQRQLKTVALAELIRNAGLTMPEPEFISCGHQGLRHRLDFTMQFNPEAKSFIFGFYDRNKDLIDIGICQQLAPELQLIFNEFRRFSFFHGETPVKKGSVRLRVGPSGIKGCWLDFANLDIKALLEDKRVLSELLEAGFFVEIGQKGKRLVKSDGGLKLSDPAPQVWFATQGLSMLGLISDFTQPSWITGNALTDLALRWLPQAKDSELVEFGAGLGQFTLAFLKMGFTVQACEISELATASMMASAKLHQLEKKLSVSVGDFHLKKAELSEETTVAFVNPARSGLKNFTEALLNSKIEKIIYVSCFPESMIEDVKKLSSAFRIEKAAIVDQFPQTRHYEVGLSLSRLR